MALGEAAGIAVALAHRLGRPPSVFVESPLALQQLQKALRLAGLRLHAPRKVATEDVLDPAYPDAVELLRRGLFNGSYSIVLHPRWIAPAPWDVPARVAGQPGALL